MTKKRAMAQDRWDETPRLDIGYAKNQPNWPYWVQPRYYNVTDWYKMDLWMRSTFGDTNWSDKGRWVGSDRKYWFRAEADRTLFLLKWA